MYPYQTQDPTGPSRSHAQTVKDAEVAFEQGTPVNGVKGPTYLSVVPKYDLVRGTAVDYMHGVLLGVTRMLLSLWFGSEHHTELWYCGHQVQLCDNRLASIKPPCFVTRTPRSISKHRNYWKASEYRNWLLFFILFNTDYV